MNRIILSGNIVKDVEIRSTDVAELLTGRIAVTKPFKNTEGNYDSDFFNLTEFFENSTKK